MTGGTLLPGWCEICQADMSEDCTHYHCPRCGRRCSMMGHLNGCPGSPPLKTTTQQRVPALELHPIREEDDDVIDTRVQSVTTVVVRRSMRTPAHWNEVMKVTTLVMHELNAAKKRDRDHTPGDDEMWFEPGPDDDEISLCYRLSETHDRRGG